MMKNMITEPVKNLRARTAGGGQVTQLGPTKWRLEIPAGPPSRYRLAQLDDYGSQRRASSRRRERFLHQPKTTANNLSSGFSWRPPFNLKLLARASYPHIPGTWGFGLWNDPFSMGMLSRSGAMRMPTFPEAAWFFFAGPPNHLSLRDDQPGTGWLAQVFRRPERPTLNLLTAIPLAPLLLQPASARWLRRQASRVVLQDTTLLNPDVTKWHEYSLDWQMDGVLFKIDGVMVAQTSLCPQGPLGLVTWADNQYAAWGPDGRLGWGLLENPEAAWIEIDLSVL